MSFSEFGRICHYDRIKKSKTKIYQEELYFPPDVTKPVAIKFNSKQRRRLQIQNDSLLRGQNEENN